MKRKVWIQKIAIILLVTICSVQLSACGKKEVMQFAKDEIAKKIDEIAKENTENGGQKGSTDWERGAEDYNRVVDQFFAAVDARDIEAAKKLFAPNVLAEDPDIEKKLESLFAFYEGPTERCERDGEMAKESCSTNYGVKVADLEDWFAVVSGGTNYYCMIAYTFRDDEDAGNVGIQYVDLVSEKVICSEDFKWPKEDRIFVKGDAPGDYQTRRVGSYPYIYVPMERTLTKEDILEFTKTGGNFMDFKDQFGEPNVVEVEYCSYAYELPDENGEKRYASFLVDNKDDWKILKIRIVDDVEYVSLETLWEAEKEE